MKGLVRVRDYALYGLMIGLAGLAGCKKSAAPTTPTPTPTTYALSGFVTDGTGGAALASIVAQILDGANAGMSATTDSTGHYSITGLTAGSMNVSYSGTGYQTATNAVTVSADTTLSVVLQRTVIPTFTLTGLITDGTSGGILPNINILILDGANANKTAKSDSTGHYSITGVTAGTMTVQVSAVSYLTITASVVVSANTTQNFVLPRAPATTATLTMTIDHTSCGTAHSSPIVDAYLDGPYSGTVYNEDSPNSSFSGTVSVGTHSFQAIGSRGTSVGPMNINVTASGFTVTLICH